MADNRNGTIHREMFIAAEPAIVFAFFTDPDKMTRWMGVRSDLDARPGGVYLVNVNNKNVARGEFEEVTPNSRLVFSFWLGGCCLRHHAGLVPHRDRSRAQGRRHAADFRSQWIAGGRGGAAHRRLDALSRPTGDRSGGRRSWAGSQDQGSRCLSPIGLSCRGVDGQEPV